MSGRCSGGCQAAGAKERNTGTSVLSAQRAAGGAAGGVGPVRLSEAGISVCRPNTYGASEATVSLQVMSQALQCAARPAHHIEGKGMGDRKFTHLGKRGPGEKTRPEQKGRRSRA